MSLRTLNIAFYELAKIIEARQVEKIFFQKISGVKKIFLIITLL